MSVHCIHPVGPRRRPRQVTVGLGLVTLVMTLLLTGCGEHPEVLLAGRWRESGWEYEKFASKPVAEDKWIDGIDLPGFADRRVVRHEAEYWEFLPGGGLVIAKRDGSRLHARWRLKGRGHVLTVRGPEEGFEVYDVKGLDHNELVLNYDVGMEVRGIARLTFRRIEDHGSLLSSMHPAKKSR